MHHSLYEKWYLFISSLSVVIIYIYTSFFVWEIIFIYFFFERYHYHMKNETYVLVTAELFPWVYVSVCVPVCVPECVSVCVSACNCAREHVGVLFVHFVVFAFYTSLNISLLLSAKTVAPCLSNSIVATNTERTQLCWFLKWIKCAANGKHSCSNVTFSSQFNYAPISYLRSGCSHQRTWCCL